MHLDPAKQLLLDQASSVLSECLWLTGKNGRFIHMSPRVEKIVGIPEREASRRHLHEIGQMVNLHITDPDFLSSAQECQDRPFLVSEGNARSARLIKVSKAPVFDPKTGQYEGTIGKFAEITTEQEGRQAFATIAQEVDENLLPIMLSLDNGVMIYGNRRALSLVGETASTLKRLKHRVLTHRDYAGSEYRTMWDQINQGISVTGTFGYRNEAGKCQQVAQGAVRLQQTGTRTPSFVIWVLIDNAAAALLTAGTMTQEGWVSLTLSQFKPVIELLLSKFPDYLLKQGYRTWDVSDVSTLATSREATAKSGKPIIRKVKYTERQISIIRLVGTGASNKMIAHELGLSPETIKSQLKAIFKKMGVQNRTEIAAKLGELGL